MKVKYTPPKIIQNLFKDFIWKSKCNKVLLSFDDGPNPNTTEVILQKLNEHKCKAIFFCVGENIEKYTDLTTKIIEAGHMIGNHSQSHKDIVGINKKIIENEIKQCSESINKIVGNSPKYFRPPHGRFNPMTKKRISNYDMKNVMWTLLTYDYKNDLNIVKFAVQKYLSKDSIIVLHDSNKSKNIIAQAIDFIFEEAKRKGFEIGEPLECLK